MALKRTPEAEDAEVLRSAGILGHRYVTTRVYEFKRVVLMESDDIPTLAKLVERLIGSADHPRTFEQIRFKGRTGRKWRRVR